MDAPSGGTAAGIGSGTLGGLRRNCPLGCARPTLSCPRSNPGCNSCTLRGVHRKLIQLIVGLQISGDVLQRRQLFQTVLKLVVQHLVSVGKQYQVDEA